MILGCVPWKGVHWGRLTMGYFVSPDNLGNATFDSVLVSQGRKYGGTEAHSELFTEQIDIGGNIPSPGSKHLGHTCKEANTFTLG